MKLSELKPAEGARKSRKRVGRGESSGLGKTAGKGAKGQNARSGGGVRPGFEGGQMPIHRRLPKRGFVSIFKKKYATVNLTDLLKFEAGSVVDEISLRNVGIIKGQFDEIKILGKGDIAIPLIIRLKHLSAGAKAKIEAAGGKIEATE
jgi:large subunit ribosomal protein L15